MYKQNKEVLRVIKVFYVYTVVEVILICVIYQSSQNYIPNKDIFYCVIIRKIKMLSNSMVG